MSYFNQKKYTLGLVLLLVVLNLLALTALWANNHSKFPHPPHHKNQHFLEAELELSDAQQEQFRNFREEHFGRMEKADQQIHQYKKAMFQELVAPESNHSIVDSVTQQIGKWESTRQQYIFQHFQELKSVCNPKQQEKFGKVFQNVITQPHPPQTQKRGNHPPPRH